jgi:hypothetical protein
MSKKLILPAEVKVCATCSYWDGERKVSDDNNVVVVSDCASGECLVRSAALPGLAAFPDDHDCLWEHLDPDPVDEGVDLETPRKVVGG